MMRAKYGATPGYELAGRANLFRAYSPLLSTIDGAKRMLRWNRFATDPVVTSSPDPTRLAIPAVYGALAARGDLNPTNSSPPVGPIDTVATNAVLITRALLENSSLLAQAGPTHDDQPVFKWSTAPRAIASLPHKGQPDAWDFGWVTLQTAGRLT